MPYFILDSEGQIVTYLPIVSDDFTKDTLTDSSLWSYFTGSSGIAIAGGVMSCSSTSLRMVRRQDVSPELDTRQTIKCIAGSDFTGNVTLFAKGLDANNFLYFNIASGNSLRVNKLDGGTQTQLAIQAVTQLVNGQAYWVRFSTSANVVKAEMWVADPADGHDPDWVATATLAGADATKFGDGVLGDVGIRFNGNGVPSGFVADYYMIEELLQTFTYYGNINEKEEGTAVIHTMSGEDLEVGNSGFLSMMEVRKLGGRYDLRGGVVSWVRSQPFPWPRRSNRSNA